jgi:two-component system, OmpR family, KDP operon response regulator KdpE
MSSISASVLVVTEAVSVFSHLQHIVEALGFSLHQAADLPQILLRLGRGDYDVVLLDCADPVRDAAVCREIRDLHPQLPLFLLADQDRPADRLGALTAGADDLIVRPIVAERAFCARLRSAIRRYRLTTSVGSERLVVGDLTLDLARHRVQRSGSDIALTPMEFRTLRVLMAQAGRPITHANLLATIWGPEFTQHREYLRVLIRGLRKKLERDPARPVYLLTHIHFGYLFRGDCPEEQAAAG